MPEIQKSSHMKTTLDLPDEPVRHRVILPLVYVAHPARPGEEPTSERVAEILFAQEIEMVDVPVR